MKNYFLTKYLILSCKVTPFKVLGFSLKNSTPKAFLSRSMKGIIFNILFLIFLFFPKISLAQDKGIGVYPPIIKINTTAPSSITIPIELRNLENKPIEAQISIRPFNTDLNGKISLILYKDYTKEILSLIENIKLQEVDQNVSKLVFSPNETKKVNLKINIDKETKDKDFYFSLLFLINNTDSSENTRSLISIGAGTNVLVAIGESKESYLESFSSSMLTPEGKLKFNISLTNMGQHFITVKPQVKIANIFGKIVEYVDLKEEIILPEQTKVLSNEKNQNTIFTQRKYYFGPYKASLSLDTAYQKTVSDKNLFLFVLPGGTIWLIIGCGIIITAIIHRIKLRRLKKS